MGITSYAQNFEDVLLNRVFGSTHYAFYVDIGAYNPVEDSVTKSFYDRGWDGINIEPGDIFDQLAAARPRDINLNMAVYDHAGTVSFIQHPAWHAGLSHVRPDASGSSEAFTTQAAVEIRTVPCDTLTNILANYGSQRPIAFLKIDVEGAEAAIIGSTDWRAIRPTVLLIEATKPRSTVLDNQHWEPTLLEQGYLRAYFDGINCYYVPDERADLLRHFEMPVNVLDGFQRFDPQLASAHAFAEASQARVRDLEAELAGSNAQRALICAHDKQLADANAALQRDLHLVREELETSRRHIESLPALQNAAVEAVVDANVYQLSDLRRQLAQVEAHSAQISGERDALVAQMVGERASFQAVQSQAAQLRRLIRELRWPRGPTALRAVLPLARLLRRLAGTKAPPVPPEEVASMSPGSHVLIGGTSASPALAPPHRSIVKRAAHLAYRPFRPVGRPPALRLRAFLTMQLHAEFNQLDAKLDSLRDDLARVSGSQPIATVQADDPRVAELQADIRQFGRLLEDTLITLAMSGADARFRDDPTP